MVASSTVNRNHILFRHVWLSTIKKKNLENIMEMVSIDEQSSKMHTFIQYQVANNFSFHFAKNCSQTARIIDGAFVHQMATSV